MNYSFPATKWALTSRRNEQIEHIMSEIAEFECSASGSNHEIEEAIDLYHSLETFFRILERDGVNMDNHFDNVLKKNEARGYYLPEVNAHE